MGLLCSMLRMGQVSERLKACSKHASEMNRLNFYVTHAKNLPFIENMEKRIQNASLLVNASLGHCFVDGLEHRDATATYNCLCAYASIDNTKNAVETFRVTVVAPLMQKIIPHESSAVAAGSSGDGLINSYELIKECIYKDCKFLLDISSAENSGLHVFDFLANSILREVLFEECFLFINSDQASNLTDVGLNPPPQRQGNLGQIASQF
ncbi:putative COG complex component, COG2 [Medicago truncatula]|uniref:Putative COG complex component, COG2 n=1 Tax=Medicago truncatula TaxID=3880 RepID=A0A396IXS5_MEDTR|nr:putative COG complex component, COG2 [Medicago truncatula]